MPKSAEAAAKKPAPVAVRSPLAVEKAVPQTTKRLLPMELRANFDRHDTATEQHEAAVTSVSLSFRDESGREALDDALMFRRGGEGALLRAPSADLNAAADELGRCETLADVIEVFAGIVAAGVVPDVLPEA